ncbi:hypothetical protein BH23GEM9_BH23GEM9_36300 [soil metagenome]
MPPERRLAAVWFADVVEYGRLMASDDAAALALIEQFQGVVTEAVAANGGRLVKFLGDRALAEFGSSAAAVRAALDTRRGFAAMPLVQDGTCAGLRIGVHSGEILIAADGDIFGDGVNIAARLQASAAPCEILLSEDVWKQLRSRTDFSLAEQGTRELKGLQQPLAVYAAVDPADPAQLPAAVPRHRPAGSSARPVSRTTTLIAELKRRHVVRVALAYAVIGYGVVQVATSFFPALQLPGWTVTFTAAVVMLGFPVAVVLAWAYDITPDTGPRRTGQSRADDASSLPARGLPQRAYAVVGVGVLLTLIGFGLTFRGSSPAATPTAAASIAVLPFMNLSSDSENEAFSDGLTEELLNTLAQVRGLRVPARTSSFAFKNVQHDITEIGQKLNVDMLLEGSVRKSGEQLRITAQLIRVADGSHVWSRTYDRRLADVFAIQEEIAEEIVRQIMPRVRRGGETDLVRQSTRDTDAYEAYLQGRHQFWQQGGDEGLRRAAAFFDLAIERDSSYAIAWAGLSDAYMLLGGSGFVPPHDIFPQAKAAASKALALDDRLAEGYVALASINWLYDWDWEAAARNYRASFSVNPLLHTRCVCYAWYLAVTGDPDAAVLEAERARSLDPLARLPRVIAAWMYFLDGRHESARQEVAQIFVMNPTDVSARRISAWLAWSAGDTAAALGELEQVRADVNARGGFAQRASPVVVAELASMLARSGRTAEAQELLTSLEARARQQYIPAEYIGGVHAALGRYDGAFEWLERAFAERSNLAQFHAQPLSEPLRSQPRYRALLDRTGLPAAARRR